MRELLYVPIIHTDSDLGRIAPAIDERSAKMCGNRRWETHKRTVTLFWKQIEKYFSQLDAANLKIYQDGLMADDELGEKIIVEGAEKGSRNYQIVVDLMKRGAEIRKTEDIVLLKEEYERVLKLAQSQSLWESTMAYIGYRFRKDRLMEKRDQHIARTINETLKDGEKGVLFIGAYHDVSPYLAKDIVIKAVKDKGSVKEYLKALVLERNATRFNQLAAYMVAAVEERLS